MNSLNSILIEGNLVNEPRLITTSKNGNKLVVFRIANNRIYTDREGVKQKETLFLDVNAWGDVGEKSLKHLKTGSSVRVVGRLRMSEYLNKDKQKMTSYSILADHVEFKFLKKGKDGESLEETISLSSPDDVDASGEPEILYDFT